MSVKRCKQCGLLKPEEAFRRYTYSKDKNTTGRYRLCKECESINQAYRRAKATTAEKRNHTSSIELLSMDKDFCAAATTINQIELLYEVLQRQGLQVPSQATQAPKSAVSETVDRLRAFYGQVQQEVPTGVISSTVKNAGTMSTVDIPVTLATPEDLQVWLDQDMNEWVQQGLSPEYLQETVYESLKAKYRPQLGFDKERCIPLYDDTFKAVLNDILKKFDDYEESYAELEDGE